MSKGKQKPEGGGEWNVEWLGVETLTPYANNPRKNDATVPYLKNSIQRFGFRVPLVIDRDGVIVTGHTRLKAALELGMERVPCVKADDLTPEQIKAFRLVDNKVQELSGWDFDKMDEELSALENFDMTDFGFSADGEGGGENDYTTKVDSPIYEPKGEVVGLAEMCDKSKANDLIREIEKSGVGDEIKDFLIAAANRHIRFNYRKIAEYYARADEKIKKLFEKSALVIIDYDKAIENGFVKMSSDIEKMRIEQ